METGNVFGLNNYNIENRYTFIHVKSHHITTVCHKQSKYHGKHVNMYA